MSVAFDAQGDRHVPRPHHGRHGAFREALPTLHPSRPSPTGHQNLPHPRHPPRNPVYPPMTQKLYTPEQVAEYLGVSPNKVASLLRSKQLGCAYVGSARRITEGHITQYLQLAASRAPRKRRPRPEIPADLAPVWARLTELAVKTTPWSPRSCRQPLWRESTPRRAPPQ